MINIVRLKYTDDFQGFRNVQFAQKTNKQVFLNYMFYDIYLFLIKTKLVTKDIFKTHKVKGLPVINLLNMVFVLVLKITTNQNSVFNTVF
jgi:hypothetical protein